MIFSEVKVRVSREVNIPFGANRSQFLDIIWDVRSVVWTGQIVSFSTLTSHQVMWGIMGVCLFY